VAIWLTVMDACQGSSGETYFVTNNNSDFGRKGSLRPGLVQDLNDCLGKNADLFRYCPDIPTLISELGIETAPRPEDSTIGSAIPVRTALEAALADDHVFFEFVPGISDLVAKFVGAFEGLQDLRFERLQDKVEAYRIADSVWACARGRWAGRKELMVMRKPEFVPSGQNRSIPVTFTVNATVVMKLNQEGAIIAADVTDRSRLVIMEERVPE
jgi:hypothetical protein